MQIWLNEKNILTSFAWKDERQIKVVTGIRRCGKSVLLEQYQQRLLANGVAPEQIWITNP